MPMRVAARARCRARPGRAPAAPRRRPPASAAARGGARSRRAALLLPAPGLALAQLFAERNAARADTECTSCSNSNTSLQPGDKEFATSESGLRTLDIRAGKGSPPGDGDVCVVAWTGYTAGYQGKRIESTQDYDEPFSFRLGAGEAIPAFEEAVRGMTVGGLRRVEVPGELVERLAYPIEPKAMRYAAGPRPKTFAGQRALDFVLDNQTLKPFNRTLLFDIRLDAVR